MKQFLTKTASAVLPTAYGTFQLFIYTFNPDGREHAVLLMKAGEKKEYLTRVHSQCLTGDTFLSLRCDCREQLHMSMQYIRKAGQGVIIYLNQEGRGIGLSNKVKAYALQDLGLDTVEANESLNLPIDARDYKVAAAILQDLGITKIKLLTNNPNKITQLKKYGIDIIKQIPLEVRSNKINREYLKVKKQKLGHLLNHV